MGGCGWQQIVRSAGKGVRLAIAGPLPVDYSEVIGCQRLGPPRMPAGCSSSGLEVLQVLMVGVDDDRVGRAFQVDSPLAKGSHDGEQLFVIDRIVEFGRDELPGVVCYGVELSPGIWLRQNAAEAEV